MAGVYSGEITRREFLTESVCELTVSCPEVADTARAGQFISIKCGDERLLRRPFSICCVNKDNVVFVFEVKGEGTRWLSEQTSGQNLDLLGPLGNGFDIPDGSFIVVCGGIGVPPLLFAVKSSSYRVSAILGFQNSRRIILENEFRNICDEVYITTDDGSRGIRGTVIQPLRKLLENDEYKAVLTCGPRAMLKAVADICKQRGIPCSVSLEERMGCGVGACMVCSCATIINGAETMSRVCKDGPVFDAEGVIW